MVVKFWRLPMRLLVSSVVTIVFLSSSSYAFDVKRTINNKFDKLRAAVFDARTSAGKTQKPSKQSTTPSNPQTVTSSPPAFKSISSSKVKPQSEEIRKASDQNSIANKDTAVFKNLSCLNVTVSTKFVHESDTNYYLAVSTPYDLFFVKSSFYHYRDSFWYISSDGRCGYKSIIYESLPMQLQRPIAKLRMTLEEYYQKGYQHPFTYSLTEMRLLRKQELDKEKKKNNPEENQHSKHKKKSHHSSGHHHSHHH